jgi:hypothetical protein
MSANLPIVAIPDLGPDPGHGINARVLAAELMAITVLPEARSLRVGASTMAAICDRRDWSEMCRDRVATAQNAISVATLGAATLEARTTALCIST